MIFAPYRGGVGVVADFYIGASPYAKLFAPFRGYYSYAIKFNPLALNPVGV